MCTVTYIPTADGYILSSNRDESPKRAYNPLVKEKINGHTVLFPKDTKGGSWLYSSDDYETICVLNGGKIKHQHRPPYKESRGIIARSYFKYDGPAHFIKSIDLLGIEPFTLIIAGRNLLLQFRWDGKVKSIVTKDKSLPHIWSSSTLYTPELAEKRAKWFYQYLEKHQKLTKSDIRYIHRNGSVGDPAQNYVMNRENIVRTVSISHVFVEKSKTEFEFENLIDNTLLQEQVYYTVKSI